MKQLLDNADRYSPPGSPITVLARLEQESVVVSVADCGPGVKADEQSRIFDKFYRGKHSSRFQEGTGMGLSIAKGIIEAHGGKITVSARPEGGSLFSVQLPLKSGTHQT
jgi:two-component system sensor histidine kinase KdpD